ncbi:MAG: hypothetical protein HYV27_09900 [Candidatus Hydrogenedentes bacterium]|nr:hypothetical protein [Candidatus Hydrogenedentota bacterium]
MRTVFFAIRFGMTLAGLLLIGIGVLAAVFHQQIQGFAARQIAAGATRCTGVPFKVGAVSFSVKDRGIVLQQAGFANPEGFSAAMAFASERIILIPHWNTVFSEKPVFETAFVRDPVCTVEYQPGAGSNIGALLKKLEAGGSISAPGGLLPVREFLIREVQCDPTRLQIDLKPLPSALTGATIPAFSLGEINPDGAVKSSEVLAVFVKALAKKVLSVKGLLPV